MQHIQYTSGIKDIVRRFGGEIERAVRIEVENKVLAALGIKRNDLAPYSITQFINEQASNEALHTHLGDALTERIYAYIKAHPGQRRSQIARAVGATRGKWMSRIERLCSSGRVRMTGARGGARYNVVE